MAAASGDTRGLGQPSPCENNAVDPVDAQHGTGSDLVTFDHVRSTDGGVTFGAPLSWNTDGPRVPQWEPNLVGEPHRHAPGDMV